MKKIIHIWLNMLIHNFHKLLSNKETPLSMMNFLKTQSNEKQLWKKLAYSLLLSTIMMNFCTVYIMRPVSICVKL